MTSALKAPPVVQPIVKGCRIAGRERIEISGPAGCGKSALARAMADEFRRQGKAVEILEGGERIGFAPARPDVTIVTRQV